MTTVVTLQFQSTGTVSGDGAPVQMQGSSLTIGRGSENDLELPDPDRMLSKRHCAIEDHNGSVIVVDMSTNGTFLNYGKLALGNSPTPLNDGDILSLGSYELMVSISADDQRNDVLADPLEDGPIGHGQAQNAPSDADFLDAPGDGGDFLDDLLGGREGPVGPSGVSREEPDDDGLLPPWDDDDPLLAPAPDPHGTQGASSAEHNPSAQDNFAAPRPNNPAAIPDDWHDDLLKPTGTAEDPFSGPSGAGNSAFIPDDFGTDDDEPEKVVKASPSPETAPVVEVEIPASPVAPPVVETPPEPIQTARGSDDAAARVFLKSLGADEVKLSDNDLAPTLSRMGHVMRILIEGIREILMTRTSIKSEFRIEQTMIQAGGNNPLKFSISPEQAIEAMVRPSSKGYLDATEAAQQALRDIKAHEVAMVTGMESALKGLLARLDPSVLEDKIKVGGGLGSMLKSKKARYWEVYESMYAEISDQAENDFHELFAREFARAYQDQLDRLK